MLTFSKKKHCINLETFCNILQYFFDHLSITIYISKYVFHMLKFYLTYYLSRAT